MFSVTITIALSQWIMAPFGFDCTKPFQKPEMRVPEKLGPRPVPPPSKPGKGEHEPASTSPTPNHKQQLRG